MEEYKTPEFTSNDPVTPEGQMPEAKVEAEAVNTPEAAPAKHEVPPFVPPYNPERTYTYREPSEAQKSENSYTQVPPPSSRGSLRCKTADVLPASRGKRKLLQLYD